VELSAIERALHDRSRLAFAAATEAGLPGEFRAFELGGLLVLLTTSPGLGFLGSVSGLTPQSLGALPAVLELFAAAGVPPPSVVPALRLGPAAAEPELAAGLRDLGFGPGRPRPVGVMNLAAARPVPDAPPRITEAVTAADRRLFLDTLTAGYAEGPAVTRFIRAEHGSAGIRAFLAWHDGRPAAAGAFSRHDRVAVLGGAATLAAARRTGAQTALLHRRLAAAAAAGATSAAVTAAPGSPSARNLARAGFTIHNRPSWTGPPPDRGR
jgi:GNAT superfamily N-acetyltransferase